MTDTNFTAADRSSAHWQSLLTDYFVARLANAVADLQDASTGPKVNLRREYLKGLTDAAAALGGPADCSISMFMAIKEVGKRPFFTTMNVERKQWMKDVSDKYKQMENV